jgi:hypothetical protein
VPSTLRNFLVGFALIAAGIMGANLLKNLVTPNLGIVYPLWVVVCLIPAYWYGHRIGVVSYRPWDILSAIAVVVTAVVVAALWTKIEPFSAVGLALLVCLFFLLRRRWLR